MLQQLPSELHCGCRLDRLKTRTTLQGFLQFSEAQAPPCRGVNVRTAASRKVCSGCIPHQVFPGAAGLRTACCPEDEPVRHIVNLILHDHL